MAPAQFAPFTGYDLTAVAGECFSAMLANPSWFTQAQKDTNGGNITAIIAQIATYAITAAQQIEATITANVSKY